VAYLRSAAQSTEYFGSERRKSMRFIVGFILGLAVAVAGAPLATLSTNALPLARGVAAPNAVVEVQAKEQPQASGRDCTPYNGPFGFYGNVWCQPPNERSYMRNLGSRWPMETPPSLKEPKPSSKNSDW
jgi:hypothetical protein